MILLHFSIEIFVESAFFSFSPYRVTKQLVQNLPLTLMWKLRFSIRPLYRDPKNGLYIIARNLFLLLLTFLPGHAWVQPSKIYRPFWELCTKTQHQINVNEMFWTICLVTLYFMRSNVTLLSETSLS